MQNRNNRPGAAKSGLGRLSGRKNCVPTDFIFRGIFDNTTSALEQAHSIARQKNRVEDFRILHGALTGEVDEIITINDVPLQFGEDKRYSDRQVSLINSR